MPTQFSAPDLQTAIYIKGAAGEKPIVPGDFAKLEAIAKRKMSKEGFAYIAGGAGLESTIRSNTSDFGKWRIVPRMLKDVSVRDTSIELFGKRISAPLLTSPIGVLEMAHKEADLAVAKATSAVNLPMIFSNQASVAMEECAAVMGDSPRLFQLYWSKSNDLVASLVQRAEKIGCNAITVTLDTTLLGYRIQDLDLAFLPFLKGMGIAQYTSDPVFNKLVQAAPDEPLKVKPKFGLKLIQHLIKVNSRHPGSFFQNLRSGIPMKSVKTFTNIYSRPSLNWSDLSFLRSVTNLPIILKGILHPEDAKRAVDEGLDGILVSNHGGRQVDGSISSIAALPSIVEAVDGQIPILLDSGIRGGADMFKAIALGAKAVCVGRPYVYGLAAAGSAGVEQVLKNFIADFELTMGLAGCKSVSEIRKEMLVKV